MNQTKYHKHISDAINILAALGMPRAQQNERSALWRQSNAITTADCRTMMWAAGFSDLMDAAGNISSPLGAIPTAQA